jgi:MinD-like ATPase involved in chromosome partitioning or flagellar assembly
MATISLLSAKGAPGVTTATVALALAWSGVHPGRSALAIDADPAGGDTAAGVLRGTAPAHAGVLPLATSRGVSARQAVDSASVHLRADGSARLVPGVPDRARSAALGLAWDTISQQVDELAGEGCDVLVDAGRVDGSAPIAPWIAQSDMAVLVTRPSLPSVLAAHQFASSWSSPHVPLSLVVVDSESPYRPTEVSEAVGVGLIGVLPFDQRNARVHSEGVVPPRGFERSGYARGVHRVAAELGAAAKIRTEKVGGA